MLRPGISVAMSAYNEEEFIRGSLDSVAGWADEIVVVNGSSTDRTEAIAREYTELIITTTNKLMLEANKNIAIDAATCEWILVLDPDEHVTPELAAELQMISALGEGAKAGYRMPRRNHELGRWIRHMGHYPSRQLRFFRNGRARFPLERLHQMVEVDGPVGDLTGHLDHWPRQSIWSYVQKRNLYSEHYAKSQYEQGVAFRRRDLAVRPVKAFAKQYVAKGGWREGMPGVIIGVSGAYAAFLREAKLWEQWRDHGVVPDMLAATAAAETPAGAPADVAPFRVP